MHARGGRLSRLVEELVTLPLAIPGLAIALALLLTYGSFGEFRRSWLFILAGHVVFTMLVTALVGVPSGVIGWRRGRRRSREDLAPRRAARLEGRSRAERRALVYQLLYRQPLRSTPLMVLAVFLIIGMALIGALPRWLIWGGGAILVWHLLSLAFLRLRLNQARSPNSR